MLLGGDDIVSGLLVLSTPGHTPGHLSFEMTGGEGLLIAVDVANNEMASFEHPEWHFGYDTDPELGVRTRNLFLDGAAHERVSCMDFSGRIRVWDTQNDGLAHLPLGQSTPKCTQLTCDN